MKYDKRQKIINAAISLFSRTHDFRRVSLEAVAREAHVSPTTIYNNFSTRDNLVYEVIRNLVQANMEQNHALMSSDLPFPQKLTGIISGKQAVAVKMSNEIIGKLISQDNKIAQLIDEIYQQEIKPLWKEMVTDGKKQGFIDPAIEDEALLVYLDVMQAGFKARPDLLQGFQNNKGFIEQMMRLMYYGFLRKEIEIFRKEGIKEKE